MKKIVLSICLLVVVLAGVVSCKKGNGPKEIATTWLTAFYHMDYENAKKISTEDTKALLTQLAQFSAMVPDSVKQQGKSIVVKIKDVKEAGDKADVTYTTSDQPSKEEEIHLVKQNVKWLVQFSKNDQKGGGAEDKPMEEKPGADTGAISNQPTESH